MAVSDAEGLTDPPPFSVIVTLVAFPPKVLPLTVTGVKPHVVPVEPESARVGPLIQPHDTVNEDPVVVHPALFLTVIV